MVKKKSSALVVENEARWLELLLEFISYLTIDSKESGVGPLELYGSQRRFLAEIIEGLTRDVHLFVCLKAMQLGISTLGLAIDLFWLAVHPGMQGLLLADTFGNVQKFRVILKRMIASLPKSYAMQVVKGGDNRDHMVFANGSVLDFIAAGTRGTATEVGRSRAYNYVHASELANFGTLEGVVSLLDRVAEKNPDRLYILESTAKGYNLFWKLWGKARADPISQKAFFIGWWAKEDYAIPEDAPLFKNYWDGDVTIEEQERINNVWDKYGVRITPSQIAWYRWKCDQSADSSLMDQNFPWDEDDAFLQTGQTFFPVKRMVRLVQDLSLNPPPFKGYAYHFGEKFMDTKIRSVKSAEDAQLKIYEEPSEIGHYAMGVDPAYGRSEQKDLSCVQLYRCYADRMVQVAEFATSETESHQVAWVMSHLAGIYRDVMMIVEINGPGQATVNEIKHMKELFDAGLIPQPGNGGIEDIFGGARWFMYHRSDSPGPGYSWNWKSSQELTLTAMNELRDSLTTGLVEIRSILCALELQSMVQNGFRIEPALSSDKDDRVFASMFAHRAWTEWIRGSMISNKETWERETAREASYTNGERDTLVSHIVTTFFQTKEEERDNEEIENSWNE